MTDKQQLETRLKYLILNRSTTANSTLAIGGVPSPLDSFVVAESSVLRTNFCAEKPAHRQSAKRYLQFAEKTLLIRMFECRFSMRNTPINHCVKN